MTRKIDDILPTPNSHEFAALDAGRQRHILESRAIASSTLLPEDYLLDEEPNMPKFWYYESDSEALKRWNNTTHLSRCTTVEDSKQNLSWRH